MMLSIYLWKKSDHFLDGIDMLRSEFPDLKIKTYFTSVPKDYGDSDIVLAVDMSIEEARKASNMKALFVPYTGLDEFPEEYLKERGVEIYHSYAKSKYVAEKALALALGIMGRIPEYDSDMRMGVWGPRSGKKNRWDSLFNKRCALLGVGHIGETLAKLLTPFTGEIYSIDRGKRSPYVKRYFKTLESLAENCDILFISLPLNETTTGIVDSKILEKMEGKYLINVGRGATVDEQSLYESLKNRKLKGAGIEVWYSYPSKEKKECFPSSYPFHELDNLIMSPHIATFSNEDVWIYFDDIMEQLKKYILGESAKK